MLKMFSLQLVKNKFVVIAFGLALATVASGCSNAGNTTSTQANNSQNTATAITIDNAGVIPVFGNSATSTVVYVHNNSSSTISGITYTLANNSSGSLDGSQCVAIAAGQSCALKITTPQLSEQSNQGSMLIKADYQLAKQAHSFSQLINYAVVEDNLNRTVAGVKFKSGATISGYGNPTGYATLYLYATGVNQNYKITDLISSQPSLKFNLNLNNVTLAANSVQAIEISSPILASSISASLSVKSSLLSISARQNISSSNSETHNLTARNSLQATSFSDSVSLAVEPISAGAILIAGTVPLIDTTTGNVSTITFLNSGNQAALTGVASADNGLFGLSGDCDNQTLAPGTACTISFQYTESGGGGSIRVPYTGGSSNSASGNVTWFNGKGAALVSIAIADNPLAFSATVGGSTEVTVKNIGGYTLTNITIPTPRVVGGSATAEVVLPGAGIECIDGGELPIGSSCTYFVAVSDSATDLDQQINLGFSGTYAGTSGVANYSRVAPLTYSSTSYGAIIALSPLSAMSISGDNLESVTQELTISNNGAAAADFTSLGLVNNPAFLAAGSGDCGASLAAGESCTLALKLGPTNYSDVESSGVANYVVNYAAVGQTPAGIESASVAWSVTNIISAPVIEMQASVTGCASGNGITTTCMDNPTATGGSSSSIQVVLTFTNSSTVTDAKTISLPESSAALFSVPGYVEYSNSCTNGAAINNGSCSIIYDLPASVATTAFQSNLSQANFAYNYTYGASGELSASATSNLATMINVVMPTLSIESITAIVPGGQSTATINWGKLYQATAPTTVTSATGSDGSTVEGLSSATPATCGSVASNIASCTSVVTTTDSTSVGTGYLFNASAAGGISATPSSFKVVLSNNVIFVTTGLWNGDLGGFAGADAKCNADANKPSGSDAGAGKTYKALLNGNNATTSGVTYYRTGGITPIAVATGGNLVGAASLENSIGSGQVWTGATDNDGATYNCTNWTTNSSGVSGRVGASANPINWWSFLTATCNNLRKLYCVAQ